MNLIELLGPAEKQLKQAGVTNWHMESRWLLASVLKIKASILFASPVLEISEQKIRQFQNQIIDRINGKPLAYIIGEMPFYELDFVVNESVLIPRPETEELVEFSLAKMKAKGSMLDLCCGSGCIGLSLLNERRGWSLTLSDISNSALEVTQANIDRNFRNHPNIQVIESDLFAKLPEKNKFDVIVSNPPYIHPDELQGLAGSVRNYEPHLALIHEDPLQLYRQILKGAVRRLNPDGFVMVELSPRWADQVLNFASTILSESRILDDSSSKQRFIYGWMSN